MFGVQKANSGQDICSRDAMGRILKNKLDALRVKMRELEAKADLKVKREDHFSSLLHGVIVLVFSVIQKLSSKQVLLYSH